MKIIIVGCGKVGTTLAEQLNRENHDITLIDTNEEAIQNISDSADVMGVTGNGAVYQVQMEAGIQDADLLIATTNSDELNMLCCLIAKKGRKLPHHRPYPKSGIFIRDPLYQRRAESVSGYQSGAGSRQRNRPPSSFPLCN